MNRPEATSSDLDSLLALAATPPDPAPVPGSADREPAELRQLAITSIVPNEYQPRRRFDRESLVALAESIREVGVLQPILVRPAGPDRYDLVAGERRWRAAQLAGLDTVPAVVRVTADRGSLEQAIVENLHREDLTALEEAAAYQQLVDDFGLTQEEVAGRVGRSRSAVSNTLRLFRLPPSVQRLLADGSLTAGHGRAILSLDDPAHQQDLADRIVAGELSVRQAEEAVKSARGRHDRQQADDSPARRRSKSAAALEVERLLEERLATGVEVVESSGNGRIVIRFADQDDLDRIYRLLGD